MEWSPQQDAALKAVNAWMKDPRGEQVFRLFGYAGTGKTTLAKHFARDVRGEVLFAAYTGKAAHVLQTKGCPASTIHSLIYHPKSKSGHRLEELERNLKALPDSPETQEARARIQKRIDDEREALKRPSFTLNLDSVVQDARLVIIDECSMVDETMGRDLLSFGTRILVLGDPAQLPPIRGGGFFTAHEPHVMLTEIHRQSRDNPIIKLATDVREGRGLSLGTYGESKVLPLSSLNADLARNADQILVAKNKTRRSSNLRMRQLWDLDESELVSPGEKVVCLRNDHDIGLLNGGLWIVEEVHTAMHGIVDFTIRDIDSESRSLLVETHDCYFRGDENSLPWFQRLEAQEFDYGYALTVHKAQGSQWGDVVLLNEGQCFGQSYQRWLYTGLTRAANKITIIQM